MRKEAKLVHYVTFQSILVAIFSTCSVRCFALCHLVYLHAAHGFDLCRLIWIGHVNRMDSKRKVSQVLTIILREVN